MAIAAPSSPCAAFVPQVYRPYLCSSCFQLISAHGDGWEEVVDSATGQVGYRNTEDGRTIEKSAGDAIDQLAALQIAPSQDVHDTDAKPAATSSPGKVGALTGTWSALAVAHKLKQAVISGKTRATESTEPEGEAATAMVGDKPNVSGSLAITSPPQALPPGMASAEAAASAPAAQLVSSPASPVAQISSEAAHKQSVASGAGMTPATPVLSLNSTADSSALISSADPHGESTVKPAVPIREDGNMKALDDSESTLEADASTHEVSATVLALPSTPNQPGAITTSTLPVAAKPISPLASLASPTARSEGESLPRSTRSLHARTQSFRTLLPEAPKANSLLEPLAIGVPTATVQTEDFASDSAGSLISSCSEILETGVGRDMALAVTPFTILAIRPDPMELGLGTVAWERSLASLSFVAVQDMADAAVGTEAVASSRRRSSSLLGAMAARLSGRPRAVSSEAIAGEAAAAVSRKGAVGLLLSFAKETVDSMPLLRVARSGFMGDPSTAGQLSKRPAGRGIWRERYCRITPDTLAYGATPSAKPKGEIPLNADWLLMDEATLDNEEADVKADRDFTIRSPSTFHEFRAADNDERQRWLEAIRKQRLWLTAEMAATVSLVYPSREQAQAVAKKIEERRRALTSDPLVQDGVTAAAATATDSSATDDASLALALTLQQEEQHKRQTPAAAAATATAGAAAAAAAAAATAGSDSSMVQSDAELARSLHQAEAQGLAESAEATPGRVHNTSTIHPDKWPHYRPDASVSWSYVDDYGREQGPFPEPQMRAWLAAGFFGPETLVRCTTHGVPGLESAAEGAAATGATQQPLFALFGTPETAFAGNLEWTRKHNEIVRFQKLLASAVSLGVDPTQAAVAVRQIRSEAKAPELMVLLDRIHAGNSPMLRAMAASTEETRDYDAMRDLEI